MPAGAARVALRQLAPKPYAVDRVETLPAVERFLKATGDAEIAWLSDGVDTGRGPEFVEGLGKIVGDRTLTIFEGGAPSPLALAAAENAAAKMTVKVLRTDSGDRHAASCARSTPRVRRSAKPVTTSRREAVRPKRHSTFRSSCATTSPGSRFQANDPRAPCSLLDKRWRRRAIGIVSGSTSDTAQPLLAPTFYLHPRAGAVRRREARRSRRAATGDHAIPRPEAADDRAWRMSARCRRNSANA